MSFKNLLNPALVFCLAVLPCSALQAQEKPQFTIRPAPEEEIILAVPDAFPRFPEQTGQLADALRTFNQVLWDDLKFSGFFTMAGKSFYPLQSAAVTDTNQVDFDAWSVLPFKVSFLTAGSLELDGGILRAELRVFDMKQRTMSFGQRISGDSDQARSIAHRWADEIVYKLTAGASRGIASTKIVYSSRRGGAKEIYVMDYDGNDQHAFTRNGSNNLFPTWSPDNSKLTFVSYRTGRPEINIHSYIDGSRLPFPIFNSFVSTPVISPDGTKVIFTMRGPRGDADLYISNLDGSDRRNITNNPALDTSPTWSPSGTQIAFISDRSGVAQVYICDADGANVRRIVREGGDADCPTWSPDGRWIAFHWKPRLTENYDIFLANVAGGRINQVTANAGSNESPSWAPDSRHLVFQSTRNGTVQIFVMLADGSEVRQITTEGINTSPSWGNYTRSVAAAR